MKSMVGVTGTSTKLQVTDSAGVFCLRKVKSITQKYHTPRLCGSGRAVRADLKVLSPSVCLDVPVAQCLARESQVSNPRRDRIVR